MATKPMPDTVATAFYDEHKAITRIIIGIFGNDDSKPNEWYYKYLSSQDLVDIYAGLKTERVD